MIDRPGVYLHTLGCPKNEADSGALARRLRTRGVPLVDEPEDASHIVINTCGFIEEAREESVQVVLEAGASYPGAHLLVMGCLVERYRDELAAGLPEVEGWYGLADVDDLVSALTTEAVPLTAPLGGRSGTAAAPESGSTYSYIKISDGCDHLCSFCAIPAIKGPYAALSRDAVLAQAVDAVKGGASELILVGQDTAIWRDGPLDLLGLVDLLAEDTRVRRIRLLYLQPEHVDERLLSFMAHHRALCRYLDVPFQHASRGLLRRMARSGDGESYMRLLARARREMPDVSLRSTFIVGFPGETDDDVDELVDFIAEAGFDHAGVFAYSPEEGTRAWSLPGRVAPDIVAERLTRVGQALIDSGEAAAHARMGDRVSVLVESLGMEEGPEGAWGTGRTCGQAPDIDGITYVGGLMPSGVGQGSVVECVVEESAGYDLLAYTMGTESES